MAQTGALQTVAVIARRHKGKVAGAAVLGLAAAASGLAQPLALGQLLGTVAAGERLLWPLLVVVALFAAEVCFTALQAHASGCTGERIAYDVRRGLVSRLLRADLAAFNRKRQGDLLACLVTDTTMLKPAVSQSPVAIMVDGTMLIGALVFQAIFKNFGDRMCPWEPLDLRRWYTPEDAYRLMIVLGENGRAVYRQAWFVDELFPLVYGWGHGVILARLFSSTSTSTISGSGASCAAWRLTKLSSSRFSRGFSEWKSASSRPASRMTRSEMAARLRFICRPAPRAARGEGPRSRRSRRG